MLLIITTSNHIPSVQVSVHLSTEENQDGPERVRISQTVLSIRDTIIFAHAGLSI